VVLSGTAGTGKTALAIRFGHQVAKRFPGGQLYVNLRGLDPATPPMEPAEALRLFLDALGVPPYRIPADTEGRSALFRSLLDDRQMLIVLDNARNVAQVRPLLPGAPGSLVVVTTPQRADRAGRGRRRGSAHPRRARRRRGARDARPPARPGPRRGRIPVPRTRSSPPAPASRWP
jgi:Cdc6-related protein, AAA superfamily ATPase